MTLETLSAREEQEYNLSAALLQDEHSRSGLAWEVSADLARQMPAEFKSRGGLLVPFTALRTGLSSGTATVGAELKYAQPMPYIDMLRVQSVIGRAGATLIPDLQGTATFPRATAQATPAWKAENSGTDASDSNLLLNQLVLSPKELIASTSYSRQLLAQAKPWNQINDIVVADLVKATGVVLDAAAVGGTGASNQPTGVATQLAGAALIAFGTNGGNPTWGNLVDIEAAVATAGADYQDDDVLPLGGSPIVGNKWVTTPSIRQRIRKTDRAGGTTGWYIMGDEGKARVLGYSVLVSASVPNALTKGTSNNCCAIVFGHWADLYVGMFGPAVELVVDPFRLKKQGMIEVTSIGLYDVGVRHVGSFAGSLDALP